jgi:hypothetical protein
MRFGTLTIGAAALASLLLASGPAQAAAPKPSAGTAVARRVTGVAPARALAVGAGTAQPMQQIQGPFLRAGGKPLVLYVGALFCSYCAAERWAVVNALGRFGTFTGLGLTASATDEQYPATPSFSFHGSSYTSPYLTLQAVELSGSERGFSGTYPQLDSLNARQQDIAASLDRPPYAPEKGSIPFMVVAGRFVLFSSQYPPAALQGLGANEVASALGNLSAPSTRGILGAANWLTASLCDVTGSKPAAVCDAKAIKALRRQFKPNP